MKRQIKVLIVDDSPTQREYLTEMIAEDLGMVVVGRATNGAEAVQQVQKLKPDVVSMDVNMPVMNGFDAVREIMRVQPTPVVMVSASLEKSEVDVAFNAIQAGALAVIKKPAPFEPDFKFAREELLNTLRLMSEVKVVHHWKPRQVSPRSSVAPLLTNPGERPSVDVLGIASSTGGPSALVEIISNLPPNFPVPIVIVQHISEGFEAGLVEWLNRTCLLNIRIAQAGDMPEAGQVLVAPSFAHMYFKPDGRIALDADRRGYLNMPSGDVLFQSMAEVFGEYGMGVILTGMGADGAQGLLAMRRAGAVTLAQDEESCVVFGMPKEAINLGAAQYVVSLSKMAKVVTGLVTTRQIPETSTEG